MKNNKTYRRPYILLHNGNSKLHLTQLFKSNNEKKSLECTHNQNDKSDLDSLNSEYFKNSAHQNEANGTIKVRLYQNNKNQKGRNNQFNKTVQRYHDNSQSSAFPDSSTSITDSSSSISNQSDNESSFKAASEDINSNFDHKKKTAGVIVYDTVYLSSEESSEDQSVLCKPVIVSAVEKKLKTFSDYANIGKKNILSNFAFFNDNEYFSLPDCGISRSLNISEKIDDNLRSSFNLQFSIEEKVLETTDNITNYLIIENNGNNSPDQSTAKEKIDKNNLEIIVTDEQDRVLSNINQPNIDILDVKSDTKSNSLRKSSIRSKSRGIQKSIVRNQSFKTMSRPQILHIFGVKKKFKQSSSDETVKTEFLDKVNSVKKFWSKLNDEPELTQQQEPLEIKKKFEVNSILNTDMAPPSIEIIDINERKKTTIDSDISNTEPLFDHVRYKVLKSNSIRNNMLVHNKKDINYGSLLQYLQEYRFQELLTNNNVVIVEPIRTKVDTKIVNKQEECILKDVNTSIENKISTTKKTVKKHFFYQPIQVNREMYEDELPSPDIVRNIKKIFESELTSMPNKKLTFSSDNLDLGNRSNFHQTFYNHDSLLQRLSETKNSSKEKWDVLSVSSGISSGKHSPSCDVIFADETFNENSEEIVKSNVDISNYKSSTQKNLKESHTAHYISEVI